MIPIVPSPISLTARRPCGTLRYYINDSTTCETLSALLGHPTLSPLDVERLAKLGIVFAYTEERENGAKSITTTENQA